MIHNGAYLYLRKNLKTDPRSIHLLPNLASPFQKIPKSSYTSVHARKYTTSLASDQGAGASNIQDSTGFHFGPPPPSWTAVPSSKSSQGLHHPIAALAVEGSILALLLVFLTELE
jgi:hypothetical protein